MPDKQNHSQQVVGTISKTDRLDVFNDPRKALAALYIIILVAFWGALSFDYVNYDDLEVVKNNPVIQSLSPASLKTMFTHFHPQSYYPVRLVSYAVDYGFWGNEPIGYHLTNLLLHLFNVLLVFWLFLNLTGERNKNSIWGAFAAAVFFGIHPVVAGAVAWIPGREELLLCFFGLWCLQFQVFAQEGKHTALCLVLSACACVLACLSNVMGAAIPLVVGLYLYSVTTGNKMGTILSRTWLLWIIGAGAVFLKVLAVLSWDSKLMEPIYSHVPTALSHMGELWAAYEPSGDGGQGLLQSVLISLSVFGANIAHALFPRTMPIFYPPRIPQTLLDPSALLGLFALICLAGSFFFIRNKKIWWFGLAWFLAVTLLTSRIFPSFVWRADRFLYLPLAGLALFVGWLARFIQERIGEQKTAVLFMAVVVLLGTQTITHLPVFKNALSFHHYAVGNNPDYYLVYEYLGQEYVRQGQFDEGMRQYTKALNLAPDKNYLWAKVFKTVVMGGDLRTGEEMGRIAVRDEPENAYRHNFYGAVLSLAGKSGKAMEHFKKAAELDPKAVEPRHNLGLELSAAGRHSEAVRYLQEAHNLAPHNARISFDLARALERSGQYQKAMEFYEIAAKDPEMTQAKAGLEHLSKSKH
ncbi:MAG: tetratricopeptide repeat protein [Desulfatibacillum sp.]|nr:tetratricopeptide repeat protein [Desulfatibacillum sp.]